MIIRQTVSVNRVLPLAIQLAARINQMRHDHEIDPNYLGHIQTL